VAAGTNSTNFSGTKDAASQEMKKDVSSLRYIALPNWIHEVHLESSSSQPQDTCNSNEPESNESNGVEADVSNMETTITASPTPTLRIHKDHPKSQIIGPVDTPIQTRNKSKELCKEFEALMHEKFQMSAIDVRSANTPMEKENPWGKDRPESPFDLVAYSDSDYGGATQDRKSTTGGCQFLGRRLISWQCKKQTIVATSTTETEYVAAASGCGQVLWIQNQMLDYGYNFMNTKIYIDNNSAIYDNIADLLIKPFDVGRFQYLVVSIGMLNP
nr:putative ribonuclease H-like domain-containing protein [Tanacetum cinerariifolium]